MRIPFRLATTTAAVLAASAALAMPPATNAPGAATGTPGPAMHGGAPVAPVAKVAKASGPDARTVAEVVSGAAANKDKSVTIRAQVVKVTAGVLGKNWIHLQDGSGSADKGTHDILATSTEEAKVGEVVTVKGTVKTDVDIGSGYKYAVLVADAKIRR